MIDFRWNRVLFLMMAALLVAGCRQVVPVEKMATATDVIVTAVTLVEKVEEPSPSPSSVATLPPPTFTAVPDTVTAIPEPSPTETQAPEPASLSTESTPTETSAAPIATDPPTEPAAATDAPTPEAETVPTQPAPILAPASVGISAPIVWETTITIPTYGFENGLEPSQPDDPIFPYPHLDFSAVGPPVPKTYKGVVLENGYVAITILPELGGRVYRWFDKSSGQELLYQNPVIKPTSWGYRGWWMAVGGIEWAFPVEEHGLNEWRPWQYSFGYSDYGQAVYVQDTDDRTGMTVGAVISLDSEHSYMVIQPWARNETEQAHPYQLWSNASLTVGGNHISSQTQFIIPTQQVTVHTTGDGGLPSNGSGMSWPSQGGRDMSWYGNWGGWLGFFVPASAANYVGVYNHGLDLGIARVRPTAGWPVGTKLFGAGDLSPSLWTDDNSSYIELWSGATGSFSSYSTLEPGQSTGWTEFWYPVSELGGFQYANGAAAMKLVEKGGSAEIGLSTTTLTQGTLTFYVGGQAAAQWPLTISPGQAFRTEQAVPEGMSGALGLRLANGQGAVLAQTGLVP